MKHFFFITILCCILGPQSRALTFTGQVIDAKTGQPVPNIWVYVQDSAAATTMQSRQTTGTGIYSITWPGTPVLGTKFRIWTSSACGQGYRPSMVQYTGNATLVTDIYVCQGAAKYQLQGRVRLRSGVNNGTATLMILGVSDSTGTDSLTRVLDSFQTIPGSNGGFALQVPLIPGHKLILKATLDPGHPSYGAYLPTYYSTFPSWQTAKPLTNYAFIGDTTYIDMVDTVGTSGSGCISGYVRSGGQPLYNRIIILTTGNNAAVGFTYSNFQGYFAFNNLAMGTYKIHGDVVPKLNPALTMTLTTTKPCIPNLVFEETGNMFAARLETLGVTGSSTLDGLVASPNPVLQRFRLNGAEKIAGAKQLSVRDVSGRLMSAKTFAAGEIVEMDAAPWPAGMYFLQLQTSEGTQSYRVGKQ